MYYLFKTINVGKGDCIMFYLKNNGHELHIMVDCGQYNQEVKDFVEEKFHNRIDYLIVTHIDDDHIVGVNAMLLSNPNLSIGLILYNCYQRTYDKLAEWDKAMVANIKRIYADVPVVIDMLEYKISAESSKLLANTILSNESWKNAWQRDFITTQSPTLELGDDFGKVTFLSPSMNALNALDKVYRDLFWQHLYKVKDVNVGYKKEECIYEALLRCYLENVQNEEDVDIAEVKLDEICLIEARNKALSKQSETNAASIAFVWEHADHRVLVLGDSDPSQICESLSELYKEQNMPILYDLVKVSHHGSAHGTSLELMEKIDSEHFILTGGSKRAPSLETLARIILKPLPNGVGIREIMYNRENEILEKLSSIENSIKEKYHFSVEKINEYELSY